MDLTEPFHALMPTLDGPVLRVLAGSTEPMSRQQITNLVGDASEAGVRKVLRRLSQQGIVLEQRIGSQYTYAANRDHIVWPAVEVVMSATRRLDEKIRALVDEWEIDPLSVELFGSAATGVATVESDVDLMLYRPHLSASEQSVWDDQVPRLRAAVERWTGNPCEILEIDPPTLINMAAQNEAVLRSPRQSIAGLNLAAAIPPTEVAKALRETIGNPIVVSKARRGLAELTMTPELRRTMQEFSKAQTRPVREALEAAMRR
ncbi:MAG: nucleotidyltransferase domain-containing protein [Nocardioidaceae bacterium]